MHRVSTEKLARYFDVRAEAQPDLLYHAYSSGAGEGMPLGGSFVSGVT